MNIQDVADFIALVKDPAKFDAALQSMQDEQARLTAVIETVGVVAEIEKIRKEVAVKEGKLDSLYEQKVTAFEIEKKTQMDKIALTDALSIQERNASKIAAAELKEKEAAYKKKLAEITTREQLLVNLEAIAAEKDTILTKTLAEYDEKIAKLKAVMV